MAAATQTRFEAGKMTRCSSVCESLRESTDDTPSTQALSNTPPASCYPTMPFYTPMPMMNLPEPAAMMFPSAFDLCMSGDGFATQGFAADMGFSPLTPQQQIAAGVCQSCQMKPVALGTFFCSKRCSWFFEGRCAQCGRTRENHYIYCSGSCANQAAQANWCPTCAVRQVMCGTTSCGVMTCISHHQSAPVRQLRVKKHLRVPPTCEIMGPHDKLRETVFSQFSPALQSGVATSVLAIIKINGDNNRRKSYLNHRAFVETNIAQRNVMKYGYGGEGNEQRRFFAMHMKCKLGFNGMVEPCTPEDPNQCCDVAVFFNTASSCDACSVHLTTALHLQ